MMHTEVFKPDFLQRPSVKTLLQAFPRHATSVRFVGGCVRDALLGQNPKDLDLATIYTPEEVLMYLKQHHIKAIPTGIAHGTITALVAGDIFEITTLRRDVLSHGRHADVAFTMDWYEDALRRDFTFNAIYLDENGQLFDFCHGIEDLHQGCVRFIGKASDRIREDALRILRFFRFHGRFGQGKEPDSIAFEACAELSLLLKNLSKERVTQEITALLLLKNPHDAIALMNRSGVWETLFQKKANIGQLCNMVMWEKKLDLIPGLRRRLWAVYHENRAGLSSLRFKKSYLKQIEMLEYFVDQERDGRVVAYEGGYDFFEDWTLARVRSEESLSVLKKALKLTRAKVYLSFPLSGHDIEALGLSGPDVGKCLSQIRLWWIKNDMIPDKQACLLKAKSLT